MQLMFEVFSTSVITQTSYEKPFKRSIKVLISQKNLNGLELTASEINLTAFNYFVNNNLEFLLILSFQLE